MKRVNGETVKKQRDQWRAYYESNNTRGRDAILFYLGEQWNAQQINTRGNSNKETLTLNMTQKHMKRASAQLRETEFFINMAPANEEAQEMVKESNAFRKVLQNIMISTEQTSKISECGDKCLKFGYSFIEVGFGRENNKTLNLVPKLIVHRDPSIAFWDKNASHPSRVDGRFVGIHKKATKEQLKEKMFGIYKSVEHLLHEEENDIIYYWYRDYRKCKVRLLKTGEYKREESIDTTKDELETKGGVEDIFEALCEEDKIAQGNKPSPLEKEDDVCCIYFQMFINEKASTKPVLYPTDDLPVPYHHGLTEWDGNLNGLRTIPFVEALKDPQKLHNYVQSQIATIAKNSSADKWFFNDDHILTPTQEEDARNINSLEGGFHFGGDNATIRRERAGELPVTMMQAAQIAKQEIDEIGGAMIDAQQSDATVISGVAIDKITHNIGLLNLSFLAAHIEFVNTVGHLVRQMIPRLITEQRTIIAKNKDGSGEAIIINRYLETGGIENNIKDINNNFIYDIGPGPNTQMQKENNLKAMDLYLQRFPQAIQWIGDIYWRSVDSPDAGELERRTAAMMDQNLIRYGRGEISLQEFLMAAQQQQQEQLQQQAQRAQLDPQVQSANALAAAEHRKAGADEQNAQTKRLQVIEAEKTKRMQIQADALNNADNIRVKIATLMQQGDMDGVSQELEMLEKVLKIRQQDIDNREIDIAAKEAD